MAERAVRFNLLSRWDDRGTREGRRDLERFRRESGRSFGRAGDESGRRYGLRLSKSLGGGMTASAGVVRRGAGLLAAGFAAAGVAQFAKDSVTMAATFDKTMRQTAQVAKVPQKQIGELRKTALDMGAKTSFSARQAGEAMLELGKGGLTFAEQKAGGLSATLTLAAAGSLELGEAASFVVQGLGAFGLRADKAGTVAAALAGAANASTSSVEDMGLALAQTGAGARNAGLNIQETTGVLAAFANNGIKGSDAGTSLKTMLQRLVPQTKAAKDKMAELNLSFVDSRGAIRPITEIAQQLQDKLGGLSDAQRSAALQTIFGSDATRAATILMREGEKGLAKYIKATSDRAAAEKLAKTNTEGAAGAFERLSGAVETMQIRLGDALLPVLADAATTIADRIIPAVQKWVGAFRDDLAPHLGRMKQAWDDNKGAILSFATSLTGSQASLSSTGDKAKTLADAVVAISHAAGDASRFLTQLGVGLNTVEQGSDKFGAAIHTNVVAPTAAFFKQLADHTGLTGVFRRIIGDTRADLADLGVRFGETTAATRSAAAAANDHAAAVRSEKQAIDALKGALAEEETAELDVRQAKLNVEAAQKRLTELKRDGRKGSLEYRQAQLDLVRAQVALREKTDSYKDAQKRASAATAGAMSATQRATPPVRSLGEAAKTGGIRADNARVPWRKLGEDVSDTYAEIRTKTANITAKFGWQGLQVFNVGGGLKALAAGGRITTGRGPTADDNIIRVSRGETVVPAHASNDPGFQSWAASKRIPGFKTGGRIPKFGMKNSRGFVNALGDWDLQVDKVMNLAASRFKQRLEKSFGGLGGGSGPGGWRWQMAVLRSAFPGLPLISGFRPGAITATGNRSYHAMGRAVDVPPNMAVFDWIRGMFGARTKELIFSPAGNRQIWNGRPHLYSGITRANHWDHLHWAFDKGGWLMPGTTIAQNNTGRPERVLPPGPVIDETRLARLIAAELVRALSSTPMQVHVSPNAVRTGVKVAQRQAGIPPKQQIR